MRNSAISSASPAGSTSPSPRRSFALNGPSAAIDPTRDAVRADLADIRLADRVFAPHYAQAVRRYVVGGAELRDQAGAALATLNDGAVFDALEIGREQAWGIAPAADRVGYVPLARLRR